MTQTTQGQCFKVFEKQFPGKNGKPGNRWFSIKLEGNDTYFRCKSSNPGQIAGKMISIQHDAITDGQANVLSAPMILDESPQQTAEAPAAKGSTQAPASSGPSSGTTLGTSREASIHYQSSRKDALAFLAVVIQAGAIKLPAKEANKLAALEALADSYTSAYFEDVATFGAVARAKGLVKEPAKAAAAVDSGDDE